MITIKIGRIDPDSYSCGFGVSNYIWPLSHIDNWDYDEKMKMSDNGCIVSRYQNEPLNPESFTLSGLWTTTGVGI